MANTLSTTGITNGSTIQPSQVTQSIDALTGAEAYDITISGSFTTTGSTNFSGNQTLSGNQFISGSITVSGSLTVSGSSTFTNIGPAIQTGPLTLNVIEGYNMTASAGNYVEEIDSVTGSFPDGTSYQNQKGMYITHQGTYAPTTASAFLAESLLLNAMTASGHRNISTHGNIVNTGFVGYIDISALAGQSPGTFVRDIGTFETTNKGNANINYNVVAGYEYASNAQGITLSGTNASGIGASFFTNESASGYSVLANAANISGSTLFDVRNDIASGSFMDIRNDGMVILQMVSMSFSASNDSDAASKGVPIAGLYHTSGAIKIRLS